MPTSKVTELQSQFDALLNTLDHALTELTEARASKNILAIGVAAGRVHHITGTLDQIATRLDAAIKWEGWEAK